jgi:hypothetical protein
MLDPSSIRPESRERMHDLLAGARRRDEVVAVPRIWLTFALSLLVHIVALWVVLPRLPLLSPGEEQGQVSDRLQVRVAALPPPVAPAPPPPPKLPTPRRETRAILSPRPRPSNAPTPVATPALVAPSPEVPVIPMPPPPPVVAEPTSPQPPVVGDLSSFVAARRRARGEVDAPVESDSERRDRIVASNMPTASGPLASHQVKRGGGLFEITRMTYDDAQFLFFGWNKDADRTTPQAYEVRLGNNSDMRIAVVRRMIAIIREQAPGDFQWRSWRLDRIVVLSARLEDNAGLEEFLMHEMFDEAPRPPSR